MKKAICSHEEAVTNAARRGEWNAVLEKHCSECPTCGEAVETARWMRAMAGDGEICVDAREASLIWWRAQLSERQTEAAKAHSIVAWAEMALGCAVFVAVAAWVAGNWPAVQGAADWLGAGLSPQTWSAAYATGAPFWSFLSVFVLVVLFVVYPVLVEE
jgi:hypothetical protein